MNEKTQSSARKDEAEPHLREAQGHRARLGQAVLHINMRHIQTVQSLAREIRTKCEEVWGEEDVERLRHIFRLWRQPGAQDARSVLRETLLVLSMLGEEHGAPRLVLIGADRVSKLLPPISLEWLKQYSQHLNFRLEALGAEKRKDAPQVHAGETAGQKHKNPAGTRQRAEH
jgi:hypothetical protein